MGFSHKNSKPLEQGQAKGLLQKLLITVIIFFYFFLKFASGFDIYISRLSELCIKANMSTTMSLCREISLKSSFNYR